MSAYLEQDGSRYELGDYCIIGRDLSCTYCFDDELLSRRHASIVRCGEGRYLLLDLNSSNGVYVNGDEIRECFLEDGDEILMGAQRFVFRHDAETGRRGASGGLASMRAGPAGTSSSSGAPTAVIRREDSSGSAIDRIVYEDTLALLRKKAIDRDDVITKLVILYKVGRIVSSVLELDELLSKVIDLALEVLNADRGLIMLYDKKAGKLVHKVSRSRDREQLESGLRNISFSIANYTFKQGRPVLTEDALIDRRFQSSGSIQMYNIRSAMCVPLVAQEEQLGVLYVDNRIQAHSFSEEDLKLLQAFSDQVAIAIKNTILYEQLKRSLKQIQQQQEALIQSEKMAAMGQLSAGVAHEIRNPLTAISGYVQLYFAKHDESEPFYSKMKVIEQALDQINRIVEGLLGFSRKSESRSEQADVNELVEKTLVIAEHTLSRYNKVKVIRKYAENLEQVLVDPRQMQQVFLNFMINAAQAMPEGGTLTIETRGLVDRKNPERKFVEVIFRDTGVGIPKEKQELIFKPFFTEGKKDGTGLGLSISKSIVEKHRGVIRLESEVGKGTSFYIRLPAARTLHLLMGNGVESSRDAGEDSCRFDS